MAKNKPNKRVKKNKTNVKNWMKQHKHADKGDNANEDVIDVIAKYHGLNSEELRKLIIK